MENPNKSADQLRILWRKREDDLKAFWTRWSKEYLSELKNFSVNQVKRVDSLKEGNVVLVSEKHRPRQMWTLARIQELHRGRDGKVRSCSLHLPCGKTVIRPVQVIPLRSQLASSVGGGECWNFFLFKLADDADHHHLHQHGPSGGTRSRCTRPPVPLKPSFSSDVRSPLSLDGLAAGGPRGPLHGAENPGSPDKANIIDARSRASL